MLKCWTRKRKNGTNYTTCTRNARAIVPRKTKMPAKKEPGIAKPTSKDERNPRAAMMTIITSTTPDTTLFCRSLNIVLVSFDLS